MHPMPLHDHHHNVSLDADDKYDAASNEKIESKEHKEAELRTGERGCTFSQSCPLSPRHINNIK